MPRSDADLTETERPEGAPSSRPCAYCAGFFASYRCNKPLECDCPPCQGMCECHAQAADDDLDPPAGALFVALPDDDPNPEPSTP